MVEVANLGTQEASTVLQVMDEQGKPLRERVSVQAGAGKSQQIFFELREPAGGGVIIAELSEDALVLDNKVALIAPVDRRVTVRVAVKDEPLATYVLDAVKATGLVKGAIRQQTAEAGGAEVLITDDALTDDSRAKTADMWRTWRLAFERPQGPARTLTGPFVVKRGHVLLEGVSLEGMLWPAEDVGAAATQASTLPASQPAGEGQDQTKARGARLPLVYSGEQPLVWLEETYGGGPGMDVRFHLGDVRRSSLPQSPAWAVFFYNLLAARGLALPGPDRSIVPLNEQTHIKVPPGVEQVEATGPDGKMRKLAVSDRQAVLTCAQAGVYRVKGGGGEWAVSAGTLNRAESDLREATSRSWGEWVDARKSRERAMDVSWALGLAGLMMLGLHMWLTRLNRGEAA